MRYAWTVRGIGCVLASVLALGCDDSTGREPQTQDAEPLPALMRCDPVRDWNPELTALEDELAEAIDEVRRVAHGCGARGWFDATSQLHRHGTLDCAARLHSLDMATREFVDHLNPDEETPWDRLRAVAYEYASADETIARTNMPPEDIVEALWQPADGSCAALSASAYVEVGIGVANDTQGVQHWTVVVARPLP